MRSSLLFLTIVLTFVIAGCQQTEPNGQTIQVAPNEVKSSEVKTPETQSSELQSSNEDTMKQASKYPYKGTIQYIGLEGGFYGIVTDKGEKLLPMNLDKKYMKQGTVINFSGNYVKDMMTIQQWGTPFKINDVHLISLGKNSKHPDA